MANIKIAKDDCKKVPTAAKSNKSDSLANFCNFLMIISIFPLAFYQ